MKETIFVAVLLFLQFTMNAQNAIVNSGKDSIIVGIGFDNRVVPGGLPSHSYSDSKIAVECSEAYYRAAEKTMVLQSVVSDFEDAEIELYYETQNKGLYVETLEKEIREAGLQNQVSFSYANKKVGKEWKTDSSVFIVNLKSKRGYTGQLSFFDGYNCFGFNSLFSKYNLVDFIVRGSMYATDHYYYNPSLGNIYPTLSAIDYLTSDSLLLFVDCLGRVPEDYSEVPALEFINLKNNDNYSIIVSDVLKQLNTENEKWLFEKFVILGGERRILSESFEGYEVCIMVARYELPENIEKPILKEHKYFRIIERPYGF